MNSTDILQIPGFDSGRLSHAYIVSGGMAKTLAMATVCSGNGKKPCMECVHCNKSLRGVHPDISIIDRLENKREIVVDQIRGLKRDVIVVPNESEKKAYIINNADMMNINAQNAFLRILEEPPEHAVFILETDTAAELLPTVRSRCVELKSIIEGMPPSTAIIDMTDEFFSALRRGNAALVEFMFRLETLDKDQFTAFIAAAREQAAEELKTALIEERGKEERGNTLSRAERVLEKAGEYLDFNVSTGHISGMICASLVKEFDGG